VKQWIGLVARLVTGSVWIYAGALKLPHPEQSVAAVRAYQLLPVPLVEPVGYLLPPMEIAIGVCLILGVIVRVTGLFSAALFLAFIIGISSVWARGMEIDCGCFGGGGAKPGARDDYPWEIARDVALLALSLWLVVFPRTKFALDNWIFPHREASHDERTHHVAVEG